MKLVRLVRACGSKPFSQRYNSNQPLVRLVRACGSKHEVSVSQDFRSWVRLVRACGSKHFQQHQPPAHPHGQARKSLWIETYRYFTSLLALFGQARKSLWIETVVLHVFFLFFFGQARKSLWIETYRYFTSLLALLVRLVRACGSKPFSQRYNSNQPLVRLVRACGSKQQPESK